MLYVVGRRFDADAYLKSTESEADDVWTRGRRARPGSQPAKVSGFGYWIGPRNFGPLKKQVNAAVRFLESPENVRMLEGLTGEPTIDRATLEFGTRWEPVIAQNDWLPGRLVAAAGRFTLDVVIAHYPIDDV